MHLNLAPGLFTDGLASLSTDAAFAWAADHELFDLELGTGAFSPAPHAPIEVLRTEVGIDRLRRQADDAGVRIVALNCTGNPLHPDRRRAERDAAVLRDTLAAAANLGARVVVCVSGCPGAGPGEHAAPSFVPMEWTPDHAGIARWQWTERVVPFWSDIAEYARREAPGVRIALELHPGQVVFNPRLVRVLHAEVGPPISANLDPSHLFWQRIDVITAVRELGDLIAFVHAKDTVVVERLVRVNGILDGEKREILDASAWPWHFGAVGEGRGIAWWAAFCSALGAAGYAGPMSIEAEDPFADRLESIASAAHALRLAIAVTARP